MTPMLFRKKPVVVEAMQLLDDIANHNAVADWIQASGGAVRVPALDPCLYIATLEGEMRADIGDWIVRGVKGEFHPVKPDIFQLTYEGLSADEDGRLRQAIRQRDPLRGVPMPWLDPEEIRNAAGVAGHGAVGSGSRSRPAADA